MISSLKFLFLLIIFSNCSNNKSKENPDSAKLTTTLDSIPVLNNVIKIPVYKIDSSKFNNFLNHFDQNKSKISIAPLFENNPLDFYTATSLIMYGMKKKDIDLGSIDFEKIKENINKSSYDTTLIFNPFVISNMDVRAEELKKNLKGKKYANLYFVPQLEKITWDSLYHLNFHIYIDPKDFNKKFIANRVATLNPCPPAQPADYR